MSQRRIVFASGAWEDYTYWQSSDKKILKRINSLIKDVRRSPYDGIGKPEPLKHALAGAWSRRITEVHRLVYEVNETEIRIVACRYHY